MLQIEQATNEYKKATDMVDVLGNYFLNNPTISSFHNFLSAVTVCKNCSHNLKVLKSDKKDKNLLFEIQK